MTVAKPISNTLPNVAPRASDNNPYSPKSAMDSAGRCLTSPGMGPRMSRNKSSNPSGKATASACPAVPGNPRKAERKYFAKPVDHTKSRRTARASSENTTNVGESKRGAEATAKCSLKLSRKSSSSRYTRSVAFRKSGNLSHKSAAGRGRAAKAATREREWSVAAVSEVEYLANKWTAVSPPKKRNRKEIVSRSVYSVLRTTETKHTELAWILSAVEKSSISRNPARAAGESAANVVVANAKTPIVASAVDVRIPNALVWTIDILWVSLSESSRTKSRSRELENKASSAMSAPASPNVAMNIDSKTASTYTVEYTAAAESRSAKANTVVRNAGTISPK